MNEGATYSVWLTLVMAHITGDGKYYPLVEYQIKSNGQLNRLFTSLYDLQIVPGEASRYLSRCYPEVVEDILKNSSKKLAV